jgi:uncharacterized membrane protein YfcA
MAGRTETSTGPARPGAAALVGIGVAAGLFSALLGVGGGIVVVPALVLLARFPPRAAAATSLGAIGITAAAGTVVYGALGSVDWRDAALLGLPALVGALLGTHLQQRLSSRLLVALFALLLTGLGVRFLAG